MGPFARFYKLDEAKQQRILDNAAEEFTAHGYEGASLNTIISNSEISKGSFYYYFEDKMDLFVTVLRDHIDIADLVNRSGLLESPTASAFWGSIEQMVKDNIVMAINDPHLAKLGKLFHQLDPKARQQQQMAVFLGEMSTVLSQMILHGQTIGAIRDDLPMEVILELWFAIDAVFDNWALRQDFEVGDPQMIKLVTISFEFFKNAFKP